MPTHPIAPCDLSSKMLQLLEQRAMHELLAGSNQRGLANNINYDACEGACRQLACKPCPYATAMSPLSRQGAAETVEHIDDCCE